MSNKSQESATDRPSISKQVTQFVGKRFGYLIGLPCPTPQAGSSHSTNTSSIYRSDVLTKIQSKEQKYAPEIIEHTPETPVHICNSIKSMPSSKPVLVQKQILIKKSPKLVPVPDKTLCRNCGVVSFNPLICSSCKKPIQANKPPQSSPQHCPKSQPTNANRKIIPRETPCNSATVKPTSFYGNDQLSQFRQYLHPQKKSLRIQRKPKEFNRPAECITISDSSDDESQRPEVSSCSENSDASSPEKAQRDRQMEEPQPKVPRLSFDTSESQKRPNSSICYVSVDSVQIGEMKAVPTSPLQISGVEMSMTLPDAIFQLKWFAVEKIEMSPVSIHPCLYVTVTNDCLGPFRASLGMVPGKSPYYDPHGPEKQQYIIFHLSPSWFVQNETSLRSTMRGLCTTLKRRQDFFIEILVYEANRRQREVSGEDCHSRLAPFPMSSATSFASSSARTYSLRGRSKPALSPEIPEDDVTEVRPVFTGPRVQLAIYPPPPSTGGICITTEDVFCLNEGEFLNDVIIDFYLKYLVEELVGIEDKQRSHVFSSFFYKRFTQNVKGDNKVHENKNLSAAERRHSRVRKWTRNVDLFSKDFIFIPINDASHWYLAVICFPGNELKKCESLDLVVSDVRSLNESSCDSSQEIVVDEINGLPPLVIENVNRLTAAKQAGHKIGSNQINQKITAQTACNSNGVSSDVEMREASPDPIELEFQTQANKSPAGDVEMSNLCSPGEKIRETLHENNNNRNGFFRNPCILIFDSIRSVSRSKTATFLREYLNEEWRYRKSSEFGSRIFEASNMKMCSPAVPQQDNNSDCGVFLLHYAEMMFHSPIENYCIPIKSLQNWFKPEDAKNKRSIIRDVIENLRVLQS